MEKLKLFILIFVLALVAMFAYILSKSWFFFDKGIELKEEETIKEEKKEPSFPKDSVSEHAKVIWKNFIYYPIELNSETGEGFGPEKFINHAKNLTFINLSNGKLKKVFKKKTYIWDYFSGEFTKVTKPYSEGEEVKETLDIGNKMVILAMTEDTNHDGFLNQKDKIKLFVYDPLEEELISILPEDYYLEKILYNSRKNILASVVRKYINDNGKEEIFPPSVLIYDAQKNKKTLVEDLK
ncbi:MAG: hypothetical protein SFU98_06545 [Leptospiraceae bacterium]|nr:hypothetical protein [Leptospiraceae bacterium]